MKYEGPEYFIVSNYAYGLMRKIVCKRVYRSGGKGRRKRIKWVLRS